MYLNTTLYFYLIGNGNGRVRYSIASGDIKGNFAIDTYSGTIRTTSKLDFEETPMILLNIQAKIDQYEVIGYCQVCLLSI